MKTVFYKDDYSTLSISQLMPCLIQKYKGTAHSSEHYRKIQDISLILVSEKLKQHKNLTMLVDSSEASSITLEDIEYHRNKVVPAFYKRGLRNIAYIPPLKKISRIIFDEVFCDLQIDNLFIQQFNSTIDAEKWLKSQLKDNIKYN